MNALKYRPSRDYYRSESSFKNERVKKLRVKVYVSELNIFILFKIHILLNNSDSKIPILNFPILQI